SDLSNALSTLDDGLAVHPPRVVHVTHRHGDALVLEAPVRYVPRGEQAVDAALVRHGQRTERRHLGWLFEPLSRGHVLDGDYVRRGDEILDLVDDLGRRLRIVRVQLRLLLDVSRVHGAGLLTD